MSWKVVFTQKIKTSKSCWHCFGQGGFALPPTQDSSSQIMSCPFCEDKSLNTTANKIATYTETQKRNIQLQKMKRELYQISPEVDTPWLWSQFRDKGLRTPHDLRPLAGLEHAQLDHPEILDRIRIEMGGFDITRRDQLIGEISDKIVDYHTQAHEANDANHRHVVNADNDRRIEKLRRDIAKLEDDSVKV